VGGPLGGLLEGRPVAAIVEQYQARVGNVVEDRDADLERRHPVAAPVYQEDGRLYAGEVGGVVVRQAHRSPARLEELGPPSVSEVDVVHYRLSGAQFKGTSVKLHSTLSLPTVSACHRRDHDGDTDDPQCRRGS
jgi:hypothetical protein